VEDTVNKNGGRKMKALKLLVLGLLCSTFVFGQGDVPFEKQYFKDNKSEFKEALKHYEDGLGQYTGEGTRTGYPNTDAALAEFKIAYKFNPNSAKLNLMIGTCYLYSNHKIQLFRILRES
jgi:hypothetical protein